MITKVNSINLCELINTKPSELPKEFDKFNVIYKITNSINGQSYIGQAKSFKSRFYRKGVGGYLQSIRYWINSEFKGPLKGKLFPAIKTYGVENFNISILEHDIDESELDKKEIQYISDYNTYLGNGYNCNKGGKWAKGLGGLGWPSSSLLNSMNTRLKSYPNTNGAPSQWTSAGRSACLRKFPDTKGMPMNESIFSRTKRSYNALTEMCSNFKSDGWECPFPTLVEYMQYKINYSPQYREREMSASFSNYRKFGFDLTLISKYIRKDWQ